MRLYILFVEKYFLKIFVLKKQKKWQHSKECICCLQNIGMRNYQERVTIGQTDAGQSYPLCAAMLHRQHNKWYYMSPANKFWYHNWLNICYFATLEHENPKAIIRSKCYKSVDKSKVQIHTKYHICALTSGPISLTRETSGNSLAQKNN